jgi:hypothetical protein
MKKNFAQMSAKLSSLKIISAPLFLKSSIIHSVSVFRFSGSFPIVIFPVFPLCSKINFYFICDATCTQDGKKVPFFMIFLTLS